MVSFYVILFPLAGSAGSDDYEILLPPRMRSNLTQPQLGPRYRLDRPVSLEILGPRLALVSTS